MSKKRITSVAVAITASIALLGTPVLAADTSEDAEVTESSLDNIKDAAAHARNEAKDLEKAVRKEAKDDVEDDEETAAEAAEGALEESEETAEESDEAEAEATESDDDESDEDKDAEDEDAEDLKKADEALQAALDRLSEDGVGGNGVATKVLTAILAGESPKGIGAEHGKEMALIAKERREERAAARNEAGKGKPDRGEKVNGNANSDGNGNGRGKP